VISKAEVEHIAALARIELDEEEKEKYAEELSGILKFAQKLKEYDTRDVLPATHVFPLKNVYREDRTERPMYREKVFSNAPEKEDGHFKVPSIL